MRECKGERHDRAGETRNETHGGERGNRKGKRETRTHAHINTQSGTHRTETQGEPNAQGTKQGI